MSELESAEDYSYRIDATLTHKEAVRCIKARDNAVRAALIAELRANYWGNRDTSWEAEAEKLLEKYQTKEASDG